MASPLMSTRSNRKVRGEVRGQLGEMFRADPEAVAFAESCPFQRSASLPRPVKAGLSSKAETVAETTLTMASETNKGAFGVEEDPGIREYGKHVVANTRSDAVLSGVVEDEVTRAESTIRDAIAPQCRSGDRPVLPVENRSPCSAMFTFERSICSLHMKSSSSSTTSPKGQLGGQTEDRAASSQSGNRGAARAPVLLWWKGSA
jgi:cation transport regulator ChaB